MGMPISVHVRADRVADPVTDKAVESVFAELTRMDDLFSTYREDSQLSRYHRGEVTLERADPLLAEAQRIGLEAGLLTAGAFTTDLPGPDGVRRFDPTGLVKGWAVDRAAQFLAGLPGASWCVNAGGDVLVGRHRHVPPTGGDAAPWRIGIESPADRQRISSVVPLTVGAVATSGTAARGAHLYDPVGGGMVGRPGSTTVVGKALLWADVWATALFVGGPDTAQAFSRNASGCQAFAA